MLLLVACCAALTALCAGASFDQRIVGGGLAKPGDAPWQVSLQLDGNHICGAVMLSERIALTAAHCVNPSNNPTRYRFVCGIMNLNEQGSSSVASSIVQHPSYDANGLGFPNDIAVIYLANDIVFDGACQYARMPPGNSKQYDGKEALITGWGRTTGGGALPQNKKVARIPIITNRACESDYSFIFTYIRAFHICVKDPSGVMGACNGDSGGPLTVVDNDTGNAKVVGVTSFGRSGCDTNYASVYTRVGYYKDWIRSTMASFGQTFPWER